MDNLVRLGVITRIFGLKGDVICSLDFKVIPEIVIPCKVNLGFTEGYSKEILLLSSKPHSAYLVMKFENINTPQAATELIEQALFIDRKYVVYSNPFITPDLINYKIKDNNNLAMFRGGATYADAITFGADKVDKKLVDEFAKVKGKKILKYDAESDLTDYLQLYADLAK
jgi:hypothetical protein